MSPPLSASQVEQFQRDGYLLCPDLLDAGVAESVLGWVEEIAGRQSDPEGCAHYYESTPAGAVMARTERFLTVHEGLHGLMHADPIKGAIDQLFGEPACVFKDKINYKQPGGGGFAPHQDAAAYEPFGSLHITCLVAIDANTEENGCLCFAPAEHHHGLLALNDVGCLADEIAERMRWIPALLPPLGVLFFSSYAPHKSSPNNSPNARRSLYVTFGKEAEGDLRDAYYQDREQRIRDHQSAQGDPLRISTIGHFQGKAVD